MTNNDLAPIPKNNRNIWNLVSTGLINTDHVSSDGKLLSNIEIENIEQVHSNLIESDQTNPDNPKEDNNCIICLNNTRTHAIKPCFHFVLCYRCIKKIDKCPICRRSNISFQRIYS